jgi:pilus assembly protein Flp/PilA
LGALRVDRRGATAIEYGLICGLIVVVMIGGLHTLAGGSSSLWGKVKSEVENAG